MFKEFKGAITGKEKRSSKEHKDKNSKNYVTRESIKEDLQNYLGNSGDGNFRASVNVPRNKKTTFWGMS